MFAIHNPVNGPCLDSELMTSERFCIYGYSRNTVQNMAVTAELKFVTLPDTSHLDQE